jgi:hypothetical protein
LVRAWPQSRSEGGIQLSPRRGHIRQLRLQRLTGEGDARTQLLGFRDPPAGVFHTDPQPPGQRIGQVPGAHLLGSGLGGQRGDDRVTEHGLAPGQPLEALQHRQQFRRRQGVEWQRS